MQKLGHKFHEHFQSKADKFLTVSLNFNLIKETQIRYKWQLDLLDTEKQLLINRKYELYDCRKLAD